MQDLCFHCLCFEILVTNVKFPFIEVTNILKGL